MNPNSSQAMQNAELELTPLQREASQDMRTSCYFPKPQSGEHALIDRATVHIVDDTPNGHASTFDTVEPIDCTLLSTVLERRDKQRTRWLNITGYPVRAVQEITEVCLLGHDIFLQLQTQDQSLFGGPLEVGQDVEIIWCQTPIWRIASDSQWQECMCRVVVCLPRNGRAGTLITQIPDISSTGRSTRNLLEEHILRQHPLQTKALQCVWTVVFTALRFITEQLNPAFDIFDPIKSGRNDPLRDHGSSSLRALSSILNCSFQLASIQRFLSSIEEISFFFISVRQLEDSADPAEGSGSFRQGHRGRQVPGFAALEAMRLQEKLKHEQRLCKTYIWQYEALARLKLSLSTSQITSRLDSGGVVAEKLAKIGLVMAGITSVLSPFAILTGFYGMNVSELTQGGHASLFDFWSLAIPTTLFMCATFSIGSMWLMSGSGQRFESL